MKLPSLPLLFTLCSAAVALAESAHQLHMLGPQGVNLWKLNKLNAAANNHRIYNTQGQTPLRAEAVEEFQAHWFTQPVDHFSNSSETFRQRYWINTRHYKPRSGAPVIVIDGGETSGEDRLPFLDTGIADILAKATGGIGVILEHRYYGESIAVWNLTTDSLRFLNNEQSAADSANFIANVKFPGVDEDITAPNTPWIYYGGSYAGARAAHMRVLYPDLVYGAIGSSAVTHATIENWEYMEIIRQAGDPTCIAHLENSIKTIDSIFTNGDGPVHRHLKAVVKKLFGVEELQHDEDFASLIESPLSYWQAKNWNPAVGSDKFDEFCEALSQPVLVHDGALGFKLNETMFYDEAAKAVSLPGGVKLDLALLNYAKYIKENIVSRCPTEAGATIEQCFGTFDDEQYQGTSLLDTWRLWLFQVCTQWGYFFNAPPKGHPRIVSSLLTVEYESKTCKQAFLPGQHFQVPNLPNITAVNALGDFDIAADRLALIDGDIDPWKPNTPHSDYASDREDTILRPFKLIPGGVHHYDENGLANHDEEPPHIQKIHREIVHFVTEWLKDWSPPKP